MTFKHFGGKRQSLRAVYMSGFIAQHYTAFFQSKKTKAPKNALKASVEVRCKFRTKNEKEKTRIQIALANRTHKCILSRILIKRIR